MLTETRAQAEIELYRDRLDSLYGDIQCWIVGRCKGARFVRSKVELSEESVGLYKVESLEVAFSGLPAVRFIPRGTFSLGARGLVEARSRFGREDIFWIEGSGTTNGQTANVGTEIETVISRSLFPDAPEGWSWADTRHNKVRLLSEEILWEKVLDPLTK